MGELGFSCDPKKARSNESKHGITFKDAELLWDDPNFVEIAAKTVGEPRYLIIGRIEQRYWSAVVTYRGKNVRNISVRRSRPEEVQLYEDN